MSVALIIASVALVGKQHYADRQDKGDDPFPATITNKAVLPLTVDCTVVKPTHSEYVGECELDGGRRVTTGTRIFRQNPDLALDPAFLVPLEMFVQKASTYSKRILIAAPLNDRILCDGIVASLDSLSREPGHRPHVELVRVPYWGKFTPPLNILLRHATMNRDSLLLFQSIELLADAGAVSVLLKHMDSKTLVSGLAIDSCHRFVCGRQPLSGLTAPWNTFALWNVDILGRTGFLPISDGVPPLEEVDAGVEEVAAIALLQTLFPSSEAKLVRISPDLYSWDIDFKCPKRIETHHRKMHSKLVRPGLQLEALGDIKDGSVLHIDSTSQGKGCFGAKHRTECDDDGQVFEPPVVNAQSVVLDGFSTCDHLEI